MKKNDLTAHILVVEDDDIVRDFIFRVLKTEGYTATTCSTGIEALEAFHNEDFNLVILDTSLPDIPTDELCQKLIEEYTGDFLPILVMTAYSDVRNVIKMFKAGASEYLTKPVSVEDLAKSVKVSLTSRSQRRVRSQETSSPSVAIQFNFPEAVKVPCEQYLLYFVEFLKDIGIDATASLHEQAGHVLFAVTPKDKDEALENIWEALQVYLRLPVSSSTTVVISSESSIEVQKLSAQILSFQSQLVLAHAAVQQKELALQQQSMIVQQQQTLIEQQRMFSGQVLVQSLQQTNKEEDTESIAGSIVKAKKWTVEGIPVEVDLPEIIRWLKEKFARKQLS